MTNKAIDKELIPLIDDSKFFHFIKLATYIFSFGALPTAVVLQKRTKSTKLGLLEEWGKILGFNTTEDTISLKYHEKRLIYRTLLLAFLVLPFVVYLIYSFIKIFQNFSLQINVLQTNASILFLSGTVYYLGIVVAVRFLILFVDNNFADSLCIDAAFQIIFILTRDDVLIRPDKKEILIQYLNYLEKYTARIGDRYKNNNERSSWDNSHFLKMSRFVKERKKLAIMPKDPTLSTLREDFYYLSKILVSGKYGNFEWIESSKEAITDNPSKPTIFLSSFLRFIGYLIPAVLLGVYLWNSELFPNILIDKQVASLILLAWFLISIDIGFNLGIVSNLIATAKGLRDIGKI